jgi:CRISPR-associated protein Csd1
MILNALADYYQRLSDDPSVDVPPYGFEDKQIPFLVVIDVNGTVQNIIDTRTGEGKKKDARAFRLPQGEKKTSGIKANLLWDNPQYVLGCPKSKAAKDVKKAKDALLAFKRRLKENLDGLEDDGVAALGLFYNGGGIQSVQNHALFQEIIEVNANITFMLDGDVGLIAQHPLVVDRIQALYEESSGKSQISSISGELDDVAILHTAIKGVWGAQTSGANIVSFNDEAYCSHGKTKKDQGLNAPIGKHNEFAYTTSLNRLLASDKQRMQVGDASTVFWAKNPCDFESDVQSIFAPPKGEEAVSYEKIRGLLAAVKTGVPPSEADIPFYVLGLAPNASRIAIRFWYEGNLKEIKERIARHFQDLEINKPDYADEFLSIRKLLLATTRHSSKHPYGDTDDVAPHLAGEIFHSVMTGTAYPRTLLLKIVNRVKAEQGLHDDKDRRLENVTHARAALLKAYFVRTARISNKNHKEVSVGLDKSYDNIGYVLGRLFFFLERIHEHAQGKGLNKTIRDTYFSAAASSPQVTFKLLGDLSIQHLAKARNSGDDKKVALANWLDKQKCEVMALLDPKVGYPSILSLEDQGRFSIGYYHQRQDFFTKKETIEEQGEEQ